jgi:hypothetical protein
MKIMLRNGVDRGDYLGSYQLERFDIWYVILENAMVAEEFVRKNPYLFVEERDDKEGVDQGRKIRVQLYNQVDTDVRYQWVPSVISIEYVKFIMNQWGTLQSIKLQQNNRNQTTYVATLSMTLKQRDELPHTTDIPGYPRNQLVTMRGRQQLCLYCNLLGHLRYSCPQKTEDIKRKYDRPARTWTPPTEEERDATVQTTLPRDDDTSSETVSNASRNLNKERESDMDEDVTTIHETPSQPGQPDQRFMPGYAASLYEPGSAHSQPRFNTASLPSSTKTSTQQPGLQKLIEGTPLSPTHTALTSLTAAQRDPRIKQQQQQQQLQQQQKQQKQQLDVTTEKEILEEGAS